MNTFKTHLWLYPINGWRYYGNILHEAKSYDEFELKCIIRGLVHPDQNRRHDKTICLWNRHEPYESFIFFEACNRRGKGILNRKARLFRDELIAKEIENGEREEDGATIKPDENSEE